MSVSKTDRKLINKKVTALATAVDTLVETGGLEAFKHLSQFNIHTPKQLQEHIKKTMKIESVLNESANSFDSKMNVQVLKDTMKKLIEGYKVLPPINKDKYPEIKGLEGPFRTLSGHTVYYDPKEGQYYDKDSDTYISYDEFRQMDNDYSDMKDERDEVQEDSSFRDRDNFVTAYISAAEELADEEFEDGNFDWDSEAIAQMEKDAEAFYAKAEELMQQAGGDPRQHGVDFWLTRNGHGAGFWDRGYGEVGEKLTALADQFGSSHMYKGDDGKAYVESVNESEKRWKQTSMSPEEATAKYGKENVKVKKGALRNGDDMVEVFVESLNEAPRRDLQTIIIDAAKKLLNGATELPKDGLFVPINKKRVFLLQQINDIVVVNTPSGRRNDDDWKKVSNFGGWHPKMEISSDMLGLELPGSVFEAGGYYTQPVYDLIEKHGYEKVMHELLTVLDADQIQDFLKRSDFNAEQWDEAVNEAIPKSTMYGVVVDGKFIAKGNKADMRRLAKQKGGELYNSPSKKVGDSVGKPVAEGDFDHLDLDVDPKNIKQAHELGRNAAENGLVRYPLKDQNLKDLAKSLGFDSWDMESEGKHGKITKAWLNGFDGVENVAEGGLKPNASAQAYRSQMDAAHGQIYNSGKQKPPADLVKAIAKDKAERKAKRKK